MMTKSGETSREQVEIISLDELVPAEHIVRKIETAIDWSFIYGLVEKSYCEDTVLDRFTVFIGLYESFELRDCEVDLVAQSVSPEGDDVIGVIRIIVSNVRIKNIVKSISAIHDVFFDLLLLSRITLELLPYVTVAFRLRLFVLLCQFNRLDLIVGNKLRQATNTMFPTRTSEHIFPS